MKLKFVGDKFIGAGLVLKSPQVIEVSDDIGKILLSRFPKLFILEEGDGDGKKKKESKKQKEEKVENQESNEEEEYNEQQIE